MFTARVPRLLAVLVVSAALALAGAASAQEPKAAPRAADAAFQFVGRVHDRVAIFFYEDGIEPDTGEPSAPPSIPLAPITEEKSFEVETGTTVIKGGTLTDMLQIDVYLRQRYSWRNDGQNRYLVHSNPYVELESPALADVGGKTKWAIYGNGLHLGAAEALTAGMWGHDSRGNFGRTFLTKADLDDWLGPGTGAKFFAKDITVRMSVANKVIGIHNFTVGTSTTLYGR